MSSDTVPYSDTVGYNKLCGVYLIFRLDLNYIMGSAAMDGVSIARTFICIEHATIGVSIFGIFRGSFGHFYALTGFSRHFMCIIQI